MAIDYNAIIGKRAKVTVPSSDGWMSSNSIFRDPPKSITTRRIDRVDADGSLNRLYANSGDRFAENISLYAFGVNPFVAVQYSNTQASGGYSASNNNYNPKNGNSVLAPWGGKLPYRIMDGGSFRPPQLRQEQLLPLSRQPRNFTSMGSNPQYVDYTKTVMCDAKKPAVSFRQVKKPDMSIHTTATANKSLNIHSPETKEHYINIRQHTVENPTIISTTAKLSAKADLQLDNTGNFRETKRQTNAHTVHTNKSENIYSSIEPDHIPEKHRNLPEYMINTTKSENVYATIEPDYVLERQRNLPAYQTAAQKSDPRMYVAIEAENDYTLSQKVAASAHTNMNSHSDYDVNRDIVLPERLKYGGFENAGVAPTKERSVEYTPNYTTGKRDLSRKMMELRE